MKSCKNVHFFSIETINLGNHISFLELRCNFSYLALNFLKYKESSKYFQLLLILSGDISLNPGLFQHEIIDSIDIWLPFKKRGLHFMHININSLLPKIDEIRNIALKTKAAVIGISESKLDYSVNDSEINISGYNVLRYDRNRSGGGVACYIREDLCFNIQESSFSREIETVFFDLLLPKLKPISIGVFYRPPTQNSFFDTKAKDLNKLLNEENEIYLLGDFNVNLLCGTKYILKEKNIGARYNVAGTLISKYKEFCQTFAFTQLIKNPTRVACNTSSLLDHIITNSECKVSNSGIIETGLSDHQLIYCTRKIKRERHNYHKQVELRIFKNYTVEGFINALSAIPFPNYSLFDNVDTAYTDFLEKISRVINEIAPFKNTRIKHNSQEWFDGEIAEKIRVRNKLFQKFKRSKSNIDETLYKNAKTHAHNMIKNKKKCFYENKLKDSVGKPKELWKTLKSLGLPNSGSSSTKFCLKKDDVLFFDDKSISTVSEDFFSNLAENLVSKLPIPPYRFGILQLDQ